MMAGPIRNSSRSGIAKALAASPAASSARPSSTGASSSPAPAKKLVQGTLTASLGLKREPPPFIPPKPKAQTASSSSTAHVPEQAEANGSSSTAATPIEPTGPVSDETLAAFHQFFPKLADEKLPLLQLELETMGRDWLEVLSRDMAKPTFLDVRARPRSQPARARVATSPRSREKLSPLPPLPGSSPNRSSSASSSRSNVRRRSTRPVRLAA